MSSCHQTLTRIARYLAVVLFGITVPLPPPPPPASVFICKHVPAQQKEEKVRERERESLSLYQLMWGRTQKRRLQKKWATAITVPCFILFRTPMWNTKNCLLDPFYIMKTRLKGTYRLPCLSLSSPGFSICYLEDLLHMPKKTSSRKNACF